MIERVGRALAKQEGYAYDPLPYDERARAAIAAMEQPSGKMLEAAYKIGIDNPAEEYWRTMITAELKPE